MAWIWDLDRTGYVWWRGLLGGGTTTPAPGWSILQGMAVPKRWKRRDPAPAEPVAGSSTGPSAGSSTVSSGGSSTVSSEVPVEEPAAAPERVEAAPESTVVLTKEPDADRAVDDAVAPPAAHDPPGSGGRVRTALHRSTSFALLQAAHPRQALATGAGLGLAALASDRPLREAAVVAATGLVGQTVLGWHNDVDRSRDTRHAAPRKPLADGRLDVGSVWYALVVAVLLVIPLSISTGVTAGTYYLGALAVGLLGNVALRRGRFSMLSWAAQFALYVPYLSHGGWGGSADGAPPEVAMVVAFALLGVGVHFLRSIWGLVADDADKWSYLPLALGRRLGATRLLVVAAAYTVVVLAAIVVLGGTVGLRQ